MEAKSGRVVWTMNIRKSLVARIPGGALASRR
jgi:hypothetical protein